MNVPSVTGLANDETLAMVPDRAHGIAYLLQDTGMTFCRYGRDGADCAPVAWVVACVMARETGEAITYYALDSDMGRVVNDSDDVAYMLAHYATDEERESIGYDPSWHVAEYCDLCTDNDN